MTQGLDRDWQDLKPITEMNPEEIRRVASSITFTAVDIRKGAPDYVDERLHNIILFPNPGDTTSWDAVVTISNALLKKQAHGPDLKVFIAREIDKGRNPIGVHFVEDSGHLSGFSQVMFDGMNGRKVGEPYIMWTHTDKGFEGQGRGLLRTIIMGEYSLRKLGKQLDAGDMVPPTNGKGKRSREDYTHFIHIWDVLQRAGLARKIDGRLLYTGITS